MADLTRRHVIENAMVTLNSVDISNRVKKVTILTGKRAPVDVTAMQETWEEKTLVNVKNWKASLDLFQDYSTASIYNTLKGLLDSTGSSGVQLVVRPTTNARSATNPDWSGFVLMDGDFPVIDGDMVAVNMAPINLLGNGALSFLTTSS